MAAKRTKEDYIVFPVSLLALWWEDQCFDFRKVLAGIVKHISLSNQVNRSHKSDYDYLKSVASQWHIDINNVAQSTLSNNQPLTSIAWTTLNNYISEMECCGADVKDDLALLAYLALKSMLGTSVYNHFSWDAIASRMIGNRNGRISRLPREKQEELVWIKYCLGKRGREAIINRLKKWGIAYVPVGKGFKAPAFSCKLTNEGLIKALTNDGKSVIDMKIVRHKNEMPF